MVLPRFSGLLAKEMAAQTAAPEEMPTRMPSARPTSLPAAKDRKADSSGDSRWSVENCIPFKKEYIGIFVLLFMMSVRIMLFQDIQQELREQKVPDGAECWAAAVLAVMGIVAAGVYIAGVLPKILTECSDYEGSCVYFRVE